jgi:hypothetical protein
MIKMKLHLAGLAIAALLVAGPILPGHAEDAAAPNPPASAQPEAPPPSVPRPALVPKTAEPASPLTETEPAAPRHRHYAHRWHRYAYWEPFPIYLPHLYHNRIHWSRMPWIRF